MNQSSPQRGERLTQGLLFRRVPNTDGRWDPQCGLPRKGAFAPGVDRQTRVRENGISTYLAELTSAEQVLAGLDPHFGVVVIDIQELHEALAAARKQKGATNFGEVTVIFEPSDDPADGAARHAHCYIEPVPNVVQKELVRLTSPRRVVKPCGPMRPGTGSSTDQDFVARR